MTSLIELTLDKDIVEIEEDAFQDCVSLESIIYEGTEEDWNSTIGIEFVPIVDIIFNEISNEDVPELATPSDATPNDGVLSDEVLEEDVFNGAETEAGVSSDEVIKEEISTEIETEASSEEVTKEEISTETETGVSSEADMTEEAVDNKTPSEEDIKFENGEPINENDEVRVEVEEVGILPKEEDIVGDAESEEVAESSMPDGEIE